MNKYFERIYNGVVKENPTFVLMLGLCPTLAITRTAVNGLGMGISTMAVLVMSNFLISAMRKVIPDRVRIPAFIVIVASLVTVVQLLIQAYIPTLYTALGVYIPLIVVNCIILGRAESYASKFGPVLSAFDGIGMGLGFSGALTAIGAVRELLGSGTIFGNPNISVVSILLIVSGIVIGAVRPSVKSMLTGLVVAALGFLVNLIPFIREIGSVVIPMDYHVTIFVAAPGAFFILALLTALQNKFKAPSATNGSALRTGKLACGGDCMDCSKQRQVQEEADR